MKTSTIERLLTELHDETESGDRRWEEVPDERDAFFTAFDAGTLVIERHPARFQTEYGDPVKVDQYLVRVVTADGTVVAERSFVGPAGFGVGESVPVGFLPARTLWNAARETARGAEELLQALLREVRQQPPAARAAA